MTVSAKGRKQKGSRAEREVAAEIRRKGLDPNASRMPLSGADSHLKGDVRTDLPYVFEVKNQERVCFWQWWGQAKDQAHFHPPVLCITANHRPLLAVVELDTLLDLIACEQQLDAAIVPKEEREASNLRAVGSSPAGGSKSKWKRKVSGEVVER